MVLDNETLTYSCYIATIVILAIFIQGDMDKESIALSEDHDESIFDIAERPPAFLNRMQNFKVEFEKIKVSVYTHAHI